MALFLSYLSNKAFFSFSLEYDWDKYSFNLVGPFVHKGVRNLKTSSKSKFLKAHKLKTANVLLNNIFSGSLLKTETSSYKFEELNNLDADL